VQVQTKNVEGAHATVEWSWQPEAPLMMSDAVVIVAYVTATDLNT